MSSRRSALRLAGLALAGLAGCTGSPSESGDDPSDRAADRSPTATLTPTAFGGTRTPTPGPVTPTPRSDRLRWRYRTDGRMRATSSPLLDDGTVYAASDDLHAVRGGEREWRVETAGERTHRPVVVGDRLYVVSGGAAGSDASLQAISTDGDIEWTVGVTDHAGQPRVVGATNRGVFVVGFEGPAETSTPSDAMTTDSYRPTVRYVVAFDADGSERWRREIGDVSGEWSGGLQDDVLYVHPPQTTDLYAFDAATGGVRWRFGDVRDGPCLTPEGVFVVDTDGRLRMFGLDGAERWRFSRSSGSPGYVAADGRRAYLAWESESTEAEQSTIPGSLYAIEDGNERWRFDSEDERFGRPVPHDGRVYAGSFEGRVYAIDGADGSERWTLSTGGKRTVAPVIDDDTIYVFELAHVDLYAIDDATGEERWRFTPGALPAIADDAVYVGAANGTLYALSA